MKECFISLFYKFDLIGQTPQLYIFGHNRYKSSFSLILSIILIIFSAAFTLYSLILYFKFSTPTIRYSKSSDAETKRSIDLEDSFFMFQLIDSNTGNKIDDSIFSYQGNYHIIYDNGSFFHGELYIEKCDFEKNINSKYKESLKEKLNFGRPIEEFYCISPKSGNISLFYNPNIGYSIINLNILLKDITIFTPEKISSLIISENNIIDHNNKNKPISESFIYHTLSGFDSLDYTDIRYTLQYIKYESDHGLFFPDKKNFKGISFSTITTNKWKNDNYNLEFDLENYNISYIGQISLEINKSNYDNYKRSYQKVQSLLAEIMSVISFFFEICKELSFILCNKKMNKDIIEYILYPDKSKFPTDKNHNIKLSENKENNIKMSKRKIMKNDSMNKKDINDISDINKKKNIFGNSASRNEIFHNKENNNNSYTNSRILKGINYLHIFKSYFCFKDKKIQLVNICQNIISKDICIESILKRLYYLENIEYYLTKKDMKKIKAFKNKRFNEVEKYLDNIKKEEKGNT